MLTSKAATWVKLETDEKLRDYFILSNVQRFTGLDPVLALQYLCILYSIHLLISFILWYLGFKPSQVVLLCGAPSIDLRAGGLVLFAGFAFWLLTPSSSTAYIVGWYMSKPGFVGGEKQSATIWLVCSLASPPVLPSLLVLKWLLRAWSSPPTLLLSFPRLSILQFSPALPLRRKKHEFYPQEELIDIIHPLFEEFAGVFCKHQDLWGIGEWTPGSGRPILTGLIFEVRWSLWVPALPCTWLPRHSKKCMQLSALFLLRKLTYIWGPLCLPTQGIQGASRIE